MFYTGLFKRIIPFVLTFGAGLFLASFFVTLPSLSGLREGRRAKHCREHQQLRREIQNVEEKYYKQMLENNELRQQIESSKPFNLDIPEAVWEHHDPPAPPAPPRLKHPRFE